MTALDILAVAPLALGGVRLRGAAGPARDAWLAALWARLPPSMPWRRMPAHADDEALLGGLDLPATLAARRPVLRQGLLDDARGGVLVAAMAERMPRLQAARLTAALDELGRALAVVALDEGIDDEAPPPAVLDRLALWVEVCQEPDTDAAPPARLEHARRHWRSVSMPDATVRALVEAAVALGVDSARATWHASVVARVGAALAGRTEVEVEDAVLAVGLVLAPRATRVPASTAREDAAPPSPSDDPCTSPPRPPSQPDSEAPSPSASSPPSEPERADDTTASAHQQALDDRLVEAARAAIPPGLLEHLLDGHRATSARGDAGRAGAAMTGGVRGRCIGSRRGDPRRGAKLALLDTLRAAAPWQRLRAERQEQPTDPGARPRILVTRDDLRVQRRVQPRGSVTIFSIDASGSQALYRLAEAKGAVELLLADCYARRDRVAVVGFRGEGARVLLAPTRSLVRARRELAGLPGGGGTPLAAGIEVAHDLALAVRRTGAAPVVVFLTDGKANVGRRGVPGRQAARADADRAARALRADGVSALVIDSSPQPGAAAEALAHELGARCVALPFAPAPALAKVVQSQRPLVR